ncbi:MAG TPA: ParB/RepB/Spo0J family partition protein [Pseudonocardiaceae bacterium]|nr:ParB/RepB/Spo0J family partition protein [Pseudonocardiaceae bacterium]
MARLHTSWGPSVGIPDQDTNEQTRDSGGRTPAVRGWLAGLAATPIISIPIATLRPASSPRLAEDIEHVKLLAESGAQLPPIIVHRQNLRVIDGMHRLHATMLRGQRQIDARLFDGGEPEAFVLAVHANIAHGLPLSLAERKAAATRILHSHPDWSDRLIDGTAGLSHKTIGALRRAATGEHPQSLTRIGHDGRVRPVNSATGRRMAGNLMARDPAAPLGEIAAAAGLPARTVRDVRDRLRRGQDPVPAGRRTAPRPAETVVRQQHPVRRPSPVAALPAVAVMRALRADPTLRFTEAGRTLLRWLDASTVGVQECEQLIGRIPAHCVPTIARLARANADSWRDVARRLELRALPDENAG